MQVVYSGGTTTPTPSPRIQRKIGYSRPVMPGYNTHVQPQIFAHRPGEKLTEGDTTLRDSIPLMSKGVAVLCLVMNIFLPGSGTLTAGLSVLCCSKVRPRGGTKRYCIWMNSGVALIQFLLTFLFLLGWIWSITWGVAFLTISRQHKSSDHRHRRRDAEKADSKIYDTRTSTTDVHDNSVHSVAKSSREHDHNTDHKHHHAHRHSDSHHQHQHNNTDHLGYHQNNNERLQHKYDMRKSRSRTPSPRHSPGSVSRNNVSWATVTSRPCTPPVGVETNKPSRVSNGENSSAATVPYQPIIVLQKVPETNRPEAAENVRTSSPNDTIMQARTRHMKMLQRKMSDNDLSPFVLTNKQLEAIVIHDLPLVSSNGPRNNNQIDEEEAEGLPKMEIAR